MYMKLLARLSSALVTLLLLVFLAPHAFADAKSDYDYQYGLYRQNYLEFSVLKKDYLETPSLDNQQKAMLSAKQTLRSRDLAKASLAWYLTDLTNSSSVDYAPIKNVETGLANARQFFLDQAEKSQKVVTIDNLRQFSSTYQTASVEPDRIIRYGVVIHKIARLVRIQLDSQTAFDDLLPKLPTPFTATLSERVQELKTMHENINIKIDKMANGLNPAEGEENVDAEIFYTKRIEMMQDIVNMQRDWINRLIDLDLNYAQPKI